MFYKIHRVDIEHLYDRTATLIGPKDLIGVSFTGSCDFTGILLVPIYTEEPFAGYKLFLYFERKILIPNQYH
ncbi:1589_t:CDS:2 [Cetraspora pellucida]|uniref:1589_t:CDS:1 n=1 Tax=Cetraspora pellucida TaxID=1433469 RepID=A0A9N9DTU6_9GLOM|nr:1589_t:CDS:2 [Cetraspora pellucida]